MKILTTLAVTLFAILPAATTSCADSITSHARIAAGSSHSLYITGDGKLWAMGANANGQLGLGDTTERHTPVLVTTSTTVIAVSAGGASATDEHSLFLTSDGKLWAMGCNEYGQLGLGDTTDRSIPVLVTTSTTVVAIAAGPEHSLFITSDGKLWAMGYNATGQLGLGDTTERHTPVQVPTTSSVIAVAASAGCGISYSLFVTSDGQLWAMGNNQYGQLGLGYTTRIGYGVNTPAQVLYGTNVTAVSAGGGHALFMNSDYSGYNNLWCVGDNGHGQLGKDDTTSRSTPTAVGYGYIATVATAGVNHSLFVRYGTLYAMGDNNGGQLGLGLPSTVGSLIPMSGYGLSTGAGSTVIAIAADSHSLLVTSDGKLWAMGWNDHGQLGIGDTTNRNTPVLVASGLVPPAPAITMQPTNQSAAAGSFGIFAIVASGDPAPTYQWQSAPAGSTTWTNISNDTTYEGATSTMFTIHSLTAAMNGMQYRCIVHNTSGPDAISNPATLTVTGGTPSKPTVTSISPTSAQAGDTITINGANLTGATVTIGGVTVPAANVSVSADGTTLTLTVPANATTGALVITTAAGTITPTQTLTITPPPPATPQLDVDKITLSLGQNATATAPFTINSNIAWTTSITPTAATAWLAVNTPAGTGTTANAATTLTTNNTGAPRTASIVVSGSGVASQTLIATQAAPAATGLAPTGTALPVGATLTLTTGTPPTSRTYTVAANNKLTTTDATGTLTLAYEYTAATSTLVIPDLDSVYSLQFTNATAGTLILYTFDAKGTYELTGAFTYAPPAAPTYALTVTNGTGSGAYAAGATVTITANAAPSGQVFANWSYIAGGPVTFANANNATTTFTMPANATTVIAYYKDQTTGGGNNGGTGGNSGGGGGGGGGAPSLFYLAAAAALLALRPKRR